MKQGIHPDYQKTTIKCACGEVIETGSTKQDIHVEICSKCHPFFTGKQKLVDTGNTVIVIEHNLDLIKTADHIIDLGPEGGSFGGEIIAEGTPEEVAKAEGSYTGKYLNKVL